MTRRRRHVKTGHKPPMRPCTKEELKSLEDKNPTQLISALFIQFKRFILTLNNRDSCKANFDTIISLLVKVTTRLSCDACIREKASIILREVFSEKCIIFQSIINLCIEDPKFNGVSKAKRNLDSLCDFFKLLHEGVNDNSWQVLPVDELLQAIQVHIEGSDLLRKATSLIEQRNLMKEQHQAVRPCPASVPVRDNSEYQAIQIIPKWEEISSPNHLLQLRPNIVNGNYDSWLHYFDIQFRLLREDFISPLRKGICDYINHKPVRNIATIQVYNGVQIVKPVFTKAGLCHEIKFTVPFKWYSDMEDLNHLRFGSLVCLSPDHFERKVFIAVVTDSDPEKLAKGQVEVMFKGSNTDLVVNTTRSDNFVMIESLAYFESCRHILHSLQVADIATMPFTSYLIASDCGKVHPPKYLMSNGVTYNVQFIVKQNCKVRSRFTNVNIMDSSRWPTFQMTDLDKSQFEAVQMALTQEVAVIQGPPGTGKTFIGLKIVQALLKNRHIWNKLQRRSDGLIGFRPPCPHTKQSPILVMCVTNHALDQFLEGILDMHEGEDLKLIRIGGQSKSEKLQQCRFYNAKRKLRNVPQSGYTVMNDLFQKAKKEGVALSHEISDFEDPKSKFIGFDEIKCVIDQHHYQSLLEFAETAEEEQIAMELWLGLYVKEVYEEYVPVEQCASKDSEDDCKHNLPSVEGDSHNAEGDEAIAELTEMFEKMEIEECLYNTLHTTRNVLHKNVHDLRKCIMKEPAMPESKVDKVSDICSLSLKDRYELYMYWHKKYRAYLLDRLEDHCIVFNQKCELANEAKKMTELYPLEGTDVIGMTTTGAAKHRHILDIVSPKIVIVEEAAEVLESHIVSALNAGTQHLILIGDHKQLRPKTNEYDMEVKYNLHISLFERLVKNNFPHTTLKIQHRMRPEIADPVRNHIYGSDVLCDDQSVKRFSKIRGICNNIFFIQHTEPERASDRSRSNSHEAAYLSSLCKFLLQQGYETSQITVIVMYAKQLSVMNSYMAMSDPILEEVRVATVDSFQGEESDIILLSLVRSNENGFIGFLKTKNRVCVALSRAKCGFYCIGNFNMLRKGASLWESLISDMESKGMVGESLGIHCNNHPEFMKRAKSPDDFAKYFPTGGCNLPCEFRLKCGHMCTLTCHSSDPDHEKYQCMELCNQQCPKGHFYEKLCYEESTCTEFVQKTLPFCGHLQELQCSQDPACVQCTMLCVKVFPSCGHSQEMYCNQRSEFRNVLCHRQCEKSCPEGHACPSLCYQSCPPCQVLITVELPVCGHMQEKFCHQDIADIQCKTLCERKCKAGHPYRLMCHESCQPCKVRVVKDFRCGHSAEVRCSEYDDIHCSMPCTKKLTCGHKCPSVCGQPCLDASCIEPVDITLPKCRHKKVVPCPMKDKLGIEPRKKKLPCSEACTGDLCTVQCDEICQKKLRCGHPCQNLCSEICTTECEYQVIKKYPCGHQHRLPCSSPIEEHPCDIICRALLACGHTCRGKCSDCLSTRIHKPCEYSVTQRHFCGEEIEMKCVGLRDPHTSKAAKQVTKYLHCTHITIPYVYDQCATAFYKCHKPCQWSCPHHRCTKLCHELCSRPPCDEKCLKTMGCGKHRCIGLCGEICIRFCPSCDSKAFSSKLVSSRKFSSQQVYTQLPCGHIFTVQDMDKRVADRPSSVVGPLHCPECSSPLSCSFRYGNLVKESISHVEAVKAKVKSLVFSLSAEEKKRLNCMYCTISQQKLAKTLGLFPKLHTYILNFIKKLRYHDSIISKEEGFIYFVLLKVVSLHTSASQLKSLLARLKLMIEERVMLSYQVIQDLTSELYWFCCQDKLSNSHHISDVDYPVTERDLKLLDEKLKITTFNDLVKDVESFRPPILNGCWQRCSSHSHYYCVPVSEPGNNDTQCPECKGIFSYIVIIP